MSGRPELRLSLPVNGMAKQAPSWKSQRFGDSAEGRVPLNANIRRWDGAARSSVEWDSLRRDPELWFRGGNCFVHLYGKGQSRRGPAFKVPLGDLLAAQCHPLIQRFISRDVSESSASICDQFDDLDLWNHLHPARRVDIYIPAPPGTDRQRALSYHLTMRNVFAWVFRRSLVGKDLGGALVSLLKAMFEFRRQDADHVGDLLSYLDEEGYLSLSNQPVHALSTLRLAEVFHLRGLYIEAFCHCAGMSDRLFSSPEYEHISSVTKRLIRKSKVGMDLRLGKASNMLRTLLSEELSEAHLGLPTGGRAHLERFRSFIHSFYTHKFGHYPPPSIDARSTIFDPEIYHAMHADFEALHDLLVDDKFTSVENTPALAQGGICTVQSVHAFDRRCRYPSLEHPLPLLPKVCSAPATKRLTWLSRRKRVKPDQRLMSHAALMKAANNSKEGILQNDLVRAYRGFEEKSVTPSKVGGEDKIGVVDARKVRWILVYSVYQVLRSCVTVPVEAGEVNVGYNMAVSTEGLPPWKDSQLPGLPSRRPTPVLLSNPIFSSPISEEPASTSPEMTMPMSTQSPAIEIKPDIDYFAITHREDVQPPIRRSSSVLMGAHASLPERTRSLTQSISRNGTVKRSMSLFRKAEPVEIDEARRLSSYHEIVVHGYGNGTNEVNMAAETRMPRTPSEAEHDLDHDHDRHSPSSSSNSINPERTLSTWSNTNSTSSQSTDGTYYSAAESAASSVPPTGSKETPPSAESSAAASPTMTSAPFPPETTIAEDPTRCLTRDSSRRRREVVSMMIPSTLSTSEKPQVIEPPARNPLRRRRPVSMVPRMFAWSEHGDDDNGSSNDSHNYAEAYEQLVQNERDRSEMIPSPLNTVTLFKNTLKASRDKTKRTPPPCDEDWGPFDGPAEIVSPWGVTSHGDGDDDVSPMWEQFTDLGGLTCPPPPPPPPRALTEARRSNSASNLMMRAQSLRA